MGSIKIKTKHLQTGQSGDLLEDASVAIINVAVNSVKKSAEEMFKHRVCELHPDRQSTVIIKGDLKKTIVVDTDFCCEEFAERNQLLPEELPG